MNGGFTGVFVAAVLAFAAPVHGATMSVPMSNVATMQNEAGETRFLVGPGSVSLGDWSIDRAVIEVPVSSLTLEEPLRVEAWPSATAWVSGTATWRTDILGESGGRGELRRDQSRLVIDVTGALRNVVAGREFHGFLLTVPSGYGQGFGQDHSSLLAAALPDSRLRLSYVSRRPLVD
jgi:hypothetical protein